MLPESACASVGPLCWVYHRSPRHHRFKHNPRLTYPYTREDGMHSDTVLGLWEFICPPFQQGCTPLCTDHLQRRNSYICYRELLHLISNPVRCSSSSSNTTSRPVQSVLTFRSNRAICTSLLEPFPANLHGSRMICPPEATKAEVHANMHGSCSLLHLEPSSLHSTGRRGGHTSRHSNYCHSQNILILSYCTVGICCSLRSQPNDDLPDGASRKHVVYRVRHALEAVELLAVHQSVDLRRRMHVKHTPPVLEELAPVLNTCCPGGGVPAQLLTAACGSPRVSQEAV